MGTLTPGATYIYERVGGTVYAREFGADPKDRFIVGQDYDDSLISFADRYFLENDWKEIIKASRSNPALQKALEGVKILYHLSKQDGTK
jgi:hypothetical protein